MTNLFLQKHCINIDWLCLFGTFYGTMKDFESTYLTELYDFKTQPYGTRQFANIMEIYEKGHEEKLATVCYNPYSCKSEDGTDGIFSQYDATLQIHNSYFYNPNWFSIVCKLMLKIKFTYKSISRIDICCDQNRFLNNLKGETILKNYMQDKYIRMGKTRFSAYGKDNTTKVYESIAFGSGTSRVIAKMYDKTAEMKAKVMKNYIINCWEQYGIDHIKDKVWRVEFKINSDGTTLIDRETDEKTKIDFMRLGDTKYVHELFIAYSQKYFRIRIANTATRKERCKPLQLWNFDNDDLQFIPKQYKGENETRRSHNGATNRLIAMLHSPHVEKKHKKILLDALMVMTTTVPQIKNANKAKLEKYLIDKVIETDIDKLVKFIYNT